MAFGSKGRIEELEAENASLKQWVEYLKGTEPIQLAEQVQQYRSQLTGVEQQVLQARAARRHPERARRCARPYRRHGGAGAALGGRHLRVPPPPRRRRRLQGPARPDEGHAQDDGPQQPGCGFRAPWTAIPVQADH